MGYNIIHQGFYPSQKIQEKALENTKQRYAQEDHKSLGEYLNRWITWIYAGLPLKFTVLMMLSKIMDKVVKTTSSNSTPKQSCARYMSSQENDYHKHLTQIIHPKISLCV